MTGLIGRNRQALERELRGRRARHYFSPLLFALNRALVSAFQRHVRGLLLDAGCGERPYQALLEPLVERYESLDVERRLPGQTYAADIQEMPSVRSAHYDTVVCSEVLEHLPIPENALREIRRVLRPRGKIILSVPYLSRLHEEPNDFFRFTRHGLKHMLESTGFEVLEVQRIGSLLGFLGHQVSTVLVGSTWHMPLVRWVVFGINAALVTIPCQLLDRKLGSDKLPLGYVAVAVRRPD